MIINPVNMDCVPICKAVREPTIRDGNHPILANDCRHAVIDTRQRERRRAGDILLAASKHVVIVQMELRHHPDGWTGADEAVRERCVEHWRKLLDELVRALDGGAHCRIGWLTQAMLRRVGATE